MCARTGFSSTWLAHGVTIELAGEANDYTNSDVARRILEDWPAMLARFVKVMPVDYRRALSEMQTSRSRPPRPSLPHQSQLRGATNPLEVADNG